MLKSRRRRETIKAQQGQQKLLAEALGEERALDPRDALLRLLAEQEAESARSFRWYWGVLPLLLLGGGIGLLLAGVDS